MFHGDQMSANSACICEYGKDMARIQEVPAQMKPFFLSALNALVLGV